ncbi:MULTISPECIES: hypothetical protein [Corynebacterium]|jgi:hypothetical protein|uniref:Uncharacterized protein n=1 Tax=Corynebacterium provencense TaxID=1737425 RepID=A0A2Z3YN73_9CORY|nr:MULTISPECIES: hypothetical protein [Corynebacterium]AWT25159.1 hypothetical protein Csp1_03330 [Corynebacterium provencense]MCI1255583.1 hypothetical protein [Corynebacterium provencense]
MNETNSSARSTARSGDTDDPTAYEEALRRQEELQAEQQEIPYSSNADVVTMILGALMLIGLIICMTIYM